MTHSQFSLGDVVQLSDRPTASLGSIVQELVTECEVVHTSEKF